MIPPAVEPYAEVAASVLEIVGISVILLVTVVALVVALRGVYRDKQSWSEVFHVYRATFSRGILLGLEFLVGADIIQSVAVEPTWSGVGVLAVIVLIRTFLSFTLELEINGRWPWQQRT